jgi:hypothetical protein
VRLGIGLRSLSVTRPTKRLTVARGAVWTLANVADLASIRAKARRNIADNIGITTLGTNGHRRLLGACALTLG